MKKFMSILLTVSLILVMGLNGFAVGSGIEGKPIMENAPLGWLLQNFETVDIGTFNGQGIGEINPGTYEPKFASGEIVGTAAPNGGIGNQALKLVNGEADGVQLLYVWFREQVADWTKFAQDFNGDGKIDGYFGFYVDGLEANVALNIVITTAGGDLWWLSTDDTEAVMYTGWGGTHGKKMNKSNTLDSVYGFPLSGEYFMVKLDPENFRGTLTGSNPDARIDFSNVINVMIRITNSPSTYGNATIIDNVFVGVNPYHLPIEVGGVNYYNDLTKFGLNGHLLTDLYDYTPPAMDFSSIEIPENVYTGTVVTLPMPAVSDNLYGDEDIDLLVSVEDASGNPVELDDNQFTAENEGFYIVTYTARDGHNNESTESFIIMVEDEPTQPEPTEPEPTEPEPTEPETGNDDLNGDAGDLNNSVLFLLILMLLSFIFILSISYNGKKYLFGGKK